MKCWDKYKECTQDRIRTSSHTLLRDLNVALQLIVIGEFCTCAHLRSLMIEGRYERK